MDKLKDMTGVTSSGAGRQMKYPYTLTAQIRQFPFKYYYNNQIYFRYWLYGIAISFPIFVWIGSKVNSPANVKKFADAKAKEEAEHHAH